MSTYPIIFFSNGGKWCEAQIENGTWRVLPPDVPGQSGSLANRRAALAFAGTPWRNWSHEGSPVVEDPYGAFGVKIGA